MPMDEGRQRILNSVLIKPRGPDCNMACAYCFYLTKGDLFGHGKVHRMSDAILKETMRQVMTQGAQSLSIGWQGGEPTLAGLDFFERAIEYQKQWGKGHSVGNGLQTNGLVIDNRWARFLKRYNFLVGLSLDGPAHIHDFYRKRTGGSGTFDVVENTAKRLLDTGVMLNALSVVTDKSAQCAEECYTYFKSLGITYQQYIPCVEPAPLQSRDTETFSVTPTAYGNFLCKLFDLWEADIEEGIPKTSIRFFDAILERHLDRTPSDCTLLDTCGNYLLVEHNGDIFPCDFFVLSTTRLGNVMENALGEVFNSSEMIAFGEDKRHLSKACRACVWFTTCRGGCPKDRPVIGQTVQPSYFCESYKRLFEHANPRLTRIASAIAAKQSALNKEPVKKAIAAGQLTAGRNDPCPCGSKKKFKKCCMNNVLRDLLQKN